ncbi:ankyrin repeat-containing domain protein [Baffinella frigidus]|nr:ankyrin repeat-containing domain protein [Cryptophyta sp. CCMP2293]
MAAMFSRRGAVARVLLDAGADISAVDEEGRTVLHLAAQAHDGEEVAKVLLEAGVDVEGQDKEGRTALVWAGKWDTDGKVVKLLLGTGADVESRCLDGRRPLMDSAGGGYWGGEDAAGCGRGRGST